MPIINVTSSASSKKEMEQLAKAIGNASDNVSSGSVFGKLNDIKNQFTQVWTPDKASKIDAAMTTRAPATTALSNTVWTNTRAAKVDNLDDKMTSRAPANTALTKTVWTDARAKYLDKVNTNLDAAVSSRASANTALSNSVWTNARAAKVDNLDAKLTSRAPATTALSNAVWTNARAAKVDNLDAKISTVNTTATNALNEAKAAKTAAIEAKTAALSSGKKIFTSNGTFVVPTGVTKIYVTACGGGGGGGCSRSTDAYAKGCGGGGAPVILMKPVSVSSNQSIPITIGKGGKGGIGAGYSANIEGERGGNTVIGDIVMPGGYGAGTDNDNNSSPPFTYILDGAIHGGAGGRGTRGSEKAQDGQAGYAPGGIAYSSCGGGGGSYSIGGAGGGRKGGYGAGGGGNWNAGALQPSKAGDGGDGIVIIEW